MNTQTKTKKQKGEVQCGGLGYGESLVVAILFIIFSILFIKMCHHHYYYAEINGAKVRFDDYPSRTDSAYVNICINIIKDVAGTDCNIKKIEYDHGAKYHLYYDPDITVRLKYNGHTQKFKFETSGDIEYMDFPISFGPFNRYLPKYPENRLKAYPEFALKKTDYGYATQKSYLYHRRNVSRHEGKQYYFDEKGNLIEPPAE